MQILPVHHKNYGSASSSAAAAATAAATAGYYFENLLAVSDPVWMFADAETTRKRRQCGLRN
jgi:hypothetical protein